MKQIFLSIFLLLPTLGMAQQNNGEGNMPGHLTKVQNLQDVSITETRPHYVRLKGYYRSYQWNDSVLKYYKDGIVEYFVDLKNNRSDVNVYVSRCMRNSRLISQDRKRAFTYSDDQTGKPWLEDKTNIEKCRENYQLRDSIGTKFIMFHGQSIGTIIADSTAGKCLFSLNPMPTYKSNTHQMFGFTTKTLSHHEEEAYTINAEDYYSYKDLLYCKTDDISEYWYKKDAHKQLIHGITELYITEKEYVSKKSSIKSLQAIPREKAEAITTFCQDNKIPTLSTSTEQALKQLTYYNPATLKDIKE